MKHLLLHFVLLNTSFVYSQNILANTDTVEGYIYIWEYSLRNRALYFFSKDIRTDFLSSFDTYISGYPSSGWIIEKMAQDSGFYYMDYDRLSLDSTGSICSGIKNYENLSLSNPPQLLMIYKTKMVVRYAGKGLHFETTPNLSSRFKKIIPICNPYNHSSYLFTIIPFFAEPRLGGPCK